MTTQKDAEPCQICTSLSQSSISLLKNTSKKQENPTTLSTSTKLHNLGKISKFVRCVSPLEIWSLAPLAIWLFIKSAWRNTSHNALKRKYRKKIEKKWRNRRKGKWRKKRKCRKMRENKCKLSKVSDCHLKIKVYLVG